MTRINQILIPLFFFIHYLGIGVIAQVTIFILLCIELLRGKQIPLSITDIILFFGILLIFTIKLFDINIIPNILMFKFYWGFIVFYFYFKISNYRFNYLFFFWLTVIVTLIDFTLINTVIPLENMKNIPEGHAEIISLESNLLYLKRSYGLASMPTSSATILVALLASLYSKQRNDFRNFHIIVTLFTLICIGSGTGFLLLLFFVFVRFKLHKGFKIYFGIIFLLLITYFVMQQNIDDNSVFSRLSINYIERLIQLKNVQRLDVVSLLSNSNFEMLFGFNYTETNIIRTMSDFGWIDFIECYGLLGITFFIFFLIMKKKLTCLPILIFILGYFHYPALGSIPGQILFAILLVGNSNNCVNQSNYNLS